MLDIHDRSKPIHIWLSLLIASILLLSACSQATSKPEAGASQLIELHDCQLSAPRMTLRVEARCGQLEVYENRQAASGRKIKLNIAIIPAVSRNPAPDPLFFIAGGPGEAATESYVLVYSAFNRLNQKRDIVLVDQRGTGGSHPLDCALESDTDELGNENYQTLVQECVESLDADLRFYTTAIAMEDLDQVRQALGYPQINLYGASYGTRAALAYLRQFPDRVRTVILDGVAPPNWTLGPSVAADAQRAIEAIFARCQSEAACQAAFPNLAQEFQALLAQLEGQTIEVQLDDPLTGEPTTFPLNHDTFTNTMHMLSYSPETAALIPLLIHTSYREQDYRLFAAQAITTFSSLEQSLSNGMRFSVVCAEDVPNYPPLDNSTGYLGDFITSTFQQICNYWPAGQVPTGFNEAVVSSVPVLLISGEADPVTPPANATLAAQTLSNSEHWIVPGMGHINILRGCIPQLATKFVEQGSLVGVDADCIKDIAPLPLFVNFNGPTP